MYSNDKDLSGYGSLAGKPDSNKKSSWTLSLFGKKKQTPITSGFHKIEERPAAAAYEAPTAKEFKTAEAEKVTPTTTEKTIFFKKDPVTSTPAYQPVDDSLQLFIANEYQKSNFFELTINGKKYQHAQGEMAKDKDDDMQKLVFIAADGISDVELLTKQEFETMAADKFKASQGRCLVM